jgi:hypothetical protein
MASWIALTGLIIAIIAILVILYFISPIITAAFSVLQTMVKWLSMAPRAVQIFLFVFTFGSIAAIFVSIFVGNSVVCTDLSGGHNYKPYDLGLVGGMAAKALPESSIDSDILNSGDSKVSWFTSVTGTMASWFLPTPTNVIGLGSNTWGTFFTTTNLLNPGISGNNTPILFIPNDNNGGANFSLDSKLSNGKGSYSVTVCQRDDNSCYLKESGFFACGFTEHADLIIDYNFDSNLNGSKRKYIISVDPSLNSNQVYNLSCRTGSQQVKTGEFLNDPLFSNRLIAVDGQYYSVKGDVGEGLVIKSAKLSNNMRQSFIQNYVAQQNMNLTAAKGDGFLSYSCDKDANTTALFLGLDIFNFKAMLMLTVFGSLFALAAALGLFK